MTGPIVSHRKLPGNIGNGASKVPTVNIKKKISRIGPALITNTPEEPCNSLSRLM